MAVASVRVGCSGWEYAHWRGDFYPRRLVRERWLEFYAEHFDTVEVNSTFYRLASPSSAAMWVEQTPARFIFTCKASRYLTHIRRLGDISDGVARFYERLEALSDARKMGPTLWQLPESFRRDDARLERAVRNLPRGRHCFEFRHESWFTAPVYEILRKHGVALVIGDHPKRPFQSHELTANWTFIRLHYGRRGRNGNYSLRELDGWRRRIARWRAQTEVFAYFNNDWEGYAIRNAKWLREHLS